MRTFCSSTTRRRKRKFVADGLGLARRPVMHNDFVLVGPADDPAGIRGTNDVAAALRRIGDGEHVFVSRGDDSGTHKKELELWQAGGFDPRPASGTWYRESGSGMGATLNTAGAMDGYTLSDRASWVSFGNKGELEILVEGDARLHNPYTAIVVNPERHPHVHARRGAGVRRLADIQARASRHRRIPRRTASSCSFPMSLGRGGAEDD